MTGGALIRFGKISFCSQGTGALKYEATVYICSPVLEYKKFCTALSLLYIIHTGVYCRDKCICRIHADVYCTYIMHSMYIMHSTMYDMRYTCHSLA